MRRWFQFSLGRLLAAVTLVTLLASHVYTSRQLKQAREEMGRMATELGRLTITDPNRLNVLALTTYDERTWRWRVHVPPDRQYALHFGASKIPAVGIPAAQSGGATILDPGEYVVYATVRPDGLGKWKLTVGQRSAYVRLVIDQADAGWLVNGPGHTSQVAGVSGTEAAVDGKPLVLLRVKTNGRAAPNGVTEGILIWAVEQKPGSLPGDPPVSVGVAGADGPPADFAEPSAN